MSRPGAHLFNAFDIIGRVNVIHMGKASAHPFSHCASASHYHLSCSTIKLVLLSSIILYPVITYVVAREELRPYIDLCTADILTRVQRFLDP